VGSGALALADPRGDRRAHRDRGSWRHARARVRHPPRGSETHADSDVIVFGAGCTDRVRAFVDHVPARGGRWRNVTGPDAKYTECMPPVDELAASFARYVNQPSR
jgi:hypothetical protein